VEKRSSAGVCLPTWAKMLALVYCVMSCVTVNVPKAPEPLAWTVRSGMRSRFEQLIILHQQRAARAGRERVLVVGNGIAAGGRHLAHDREATHRMIIIEIFYDNS
jgi:hypothetical protein